MKEKSIINIFIIIILLNISNLTCKADGTYPFSATLFDFEAGGKLYTTDNNSLLCYFIKPSWLENYETIYYWNGLKRHNAKAKTIEYSHILDASTYNNSLLLLLKEKNNILITLFDTNNTNKIYTVIDSNLHINFNTSVQWLESSNPKIHFLLLDKNLYKINIVNDNKLIIKKIAANILCAKPLYNSKAIAFIEENTETGLLYVINLDEDSFNSKHIIARINVTDKIKIQEIQNYLVVINSSEEQYSTSLQFIDINNKNIINSIWLQTSINYIDFTLKENCFYALINERSTIKLAKISLTNLNESDKWQYMTLPENIFTIKKLKVINDEIFIVFENALVVVDKNLNITLFDYFNFKEYFSSSCDLIKKDNYLIITSKNNSLLLLINKHPYWFLTRQIKNIGNSIAYILLILLAFIFYRLYRNQKRLSEAVLALPSSGFVFIINRSGKLVKTNETGGYILDIDYQNLEKKPFLYYFKNENVKQLADIIEKGLASRLSFQEKVNIISSNNTSSEWLCSVIAIRNIAGRFRGIELTGVDITEELGKKMLNNWAQIAHDMQTNLSIIKLNAEQLKIEDNIENKNCQATILRQTTILTQRVKDVITVGSDDQLNTSIVNSIQFCNDIRSEFDPNYFKNITFDLENIEDFNFSCDKLKLHRCIRNIIENGIKAMQKTNGGTITIYCYHDIDNIYISVQDTGIGMDKKTIDMLSTPYFSTSKYEGGNGIGMTIIKRVAAMHGGNIIVESQKNKGTKITVYFPNTLKRKTNIQKIYKK